MRRWAHDSVDRGMAVAGRLLADVFEASGELKKPPPARPKNTMRGPPGTATPRTAPAEGVPCRQHDTRKRPVLPLGELRRFAGFLQAVLVALFHARIAP